MNENNRHTDFENLTGKYLAGEASRKETERLESWVKADDGNKKLFLEFKHAWQLLHTEKTNADANKAWLEMERKLFNSDNEVPVVESPTRKFSMRLVWRYAAMVSVLLTVGFLLYFLLHNPDKELIANNTVIMETLSDGSEITLNQNTKLIYPKKFSKEERLVKLEGDAFFKIARNEQKPFIIETGGIKVKVLGTSFYVDAREDKQEVEVVVASGKVAMISASGQQIELVKGEKGIFNKENSELKEAESEDENYLAWKTGKIRFENTGLFRVANILSTTYHVHITLQNRHLENCRLTATFDHQSLDNVLLIVEETLDIKVNKTANSIILSGQGCE